MLGRSSKNYASLFSLPRSHLGFRIKGELAGSDIPIEWVILHLLAAWTCGKGSRLLHGVNQWHSPKSTAISWNVVCSGSCAVGRFCGPLHGSGDPCG